MTIKATLPGGDPDGMPQTNYVMGHQSDGVGEPQQQQLFDDSPYYVRPKLRDTPAHDPQHQGSFDRIDQQVQAARSRFARYGTDDDGYDAMRDNWVGSGHDWKYSRPGRSRY